MIKRWLFILVICVTSQQLIAQSSMLLSDGVSDYIRRSELIGTVNSTHSLMLNSFSSNLEALDTLFSKKPRIWKKNKFSFRILPFSQTSQYNSKVAYGRNDGAMIPAAGYQGNFSGGFKATYGNLSIQLKPEWIVAENQPFEIFSTEQYPNYWEVYYRMVLNKIDNPESFGNGAYRKLVMGQSNIQYAFNQFSVGISTENLWWGPGRFNAIIMSNNAEGFVHATIHTTKPIETAWGNFEGQIISGQLQNSTILPPDRYRYNSDGLPLYKPKPNNSRYLHGMMASFQPKFSNGLFVGFTLVNYGYHTSANETMGSLFARYVMPKDHAEVYIEYGRNDKMPTLINVVADNNYPRAFVAGIRKLVPLNNRQKNAFIDINVEFAQLQLPNSKQTVDPNSNSWYTSSSVPQGYTNNGQIMGAGIGPGSNTETIAISYVKGFSKVGIELERYLHNNDFYYNAYSITNDPTRHWVDLSTSLVGSYHYKHFMLNGKVAMMRSLNYEWFILETLGYFKNGYDLINIHANLSLSYQF